MKEGRVYFPGENGSVLLDVRPLPRLLAPDRLIGEYVEVRNGASVPSADDPSRANRVPCAAPNEQGDFLFMPGRGGARMDRAKVNQKRVQYCIETSHFAEVNTYFHLDRIAHYLNGLLAEMGVRPIPRVIAVVHAHDACRHVTPADGKMRQGGLRPFQGGHYRLPSESHDVPRPTPSEKRCACGSYRQTVPP